MEAVLGRSLRSALRRQCRQPSGRPQRTGSIGLQNSDRIRRRFKSDKSYKEEQARPLEGFYAELLNEPVNRVKPALRTTAATPPPTELPKIDKEDILQRARVVFGTRLAGPERQAALAAQSVNIAGVLVPPRPTEPDNCCMSGCVNCVWDRYRDELEDWATKSAEARRRLQTQRKRSRTADVIQRLQPAMPSHVASSMDDDGGGSETNWDTGLATSGDEDDLFAGIPVGIREFMRIEKRLKEQKLRHAGLASQEQGERHAIVADP